MSRQNVIGWVKSVLDESLKQSLAIGVHGNIDIAVNSTSVSFGVVEFQESLFVKASAVIAYNSQKPFSLDSNSQLSEYQWCNDINIALIQGNLVHFAAHKHPDIQNMTIVQHHLFAEHLDPKALLTTFSHLIRVADIMSVDFIEKFGGITYQEAQSTIFKT